MVRANEEKLAELSEIAKLFATLNAVAGGKKDALAEFLGDIESAKKTAALHNEVIEMIDEWDKGAEGRKAELEAIEARESAVTTKEQEIAERDENSTRRHDELTEKLKAADDKLAKLEDDQQELDNERADLKKKRDAMAEKLDAQDAKNAELDTLIKDYKDKLEKLANV